MSNTHASSSDRSTFMPIWVALAAGSIVTLAGQSIRYYFTTSNGGLGGGLALLLPWLLLLVAAVLMAVTEGPLRLALVGGAGSVGMALAAPFVVDRLQGVGVPEAVWSSAGSSTDLQWALGLGTGTASPWRWHGG